MRRMQFGGQPQKIFPKTPSPKQLEQNGLKGYGSRDRVPTLQVQTPKFKPQSIYIYIYTYM
jgi:hypothetical protein